MNKIKLGDHIKELVDIGSNGSDEQISKNLNMKDAPDYAYMIRTVNLNSNNFKTNLKYVTKESYEYFKKTKMYGGEIIINKIGCPGTVGLMPFLDKPISLGLNQYALTFYETLNQKFMYYKLKHIEPYLKSIAHGTTTKTLTKEEIKNIEIEIPEKLIQDKIEYTLSTIDKKIDINNQINNNLEELMKTIYQRWFIEFEFPDEEGKPYKSSGGKLVYNEELKQKIPDNWDTKKLIDIGVFVSGFAFSSDDYFNNGKYKLYTIKNVQDGNIVSIVDNNLNEIPSNMPEECALKPKDLIMSLTGNVGRVGLVYENNALLNQRVLKIKPKNNLCFLYALFRNEHMKIKCEKISSGTSQKNLSPIELGKIKIAYSNEIVKKFEEYNTDIINEFVNNLVENQRLMELKEYLLPLLMNGQINVDDIEI